MSKISEQKALEAYPTNLSPIDNYDWNEDSREGYIQGYDQAMQDFLEKACKYLESLTVREFAGAQPERVMDDYDIRQFKNYMQNEM